MKNIIISRILNLGLLSSLKLPQNEKGVTFIEAMVAAGIFSIAITGLSLSLVQLGNSRQKVNIVNSSIALQSYLIDAISNPDSYPNDATRASIVAGSSTAISISISYVDFKGIPRNVVFSSPNWEQYFTMDLAPCAAASFNDENCAIWAKLGFNADSFAGADINNSGAATTRYVWKAAYHIEINPSTNVNVGNFGSSTASFTPADYKYSLPDLSNRSTDSMTGCNPAIHVAIRGVDRDTGQVYCILKPNPADTCNGKLPTKFVLVGNRLTLDCADGNTAADVVPRTFSCPTDYSLQVIPNTPPTPSSFFVWQPAQAYTMPTCVFRAADTQGGMAVPPLSASSGPSTLVSAAGPATNDPTITVSQGICPRPPAPTGVAYAHNASCSVSSVTYTNGQCCTIAGCTGAGVISFGYSGIDPVISNNATQTDRISCSTTTQHYWSPACQWPCAIAQPAYAEAKISVSGPATCSLTLPTNTNATANPP